MDGCFFLGCLTDGLGFVFELVEVLVVEVELEVLEVDVEEKEIEEGGSMLAGVSAESNSSEISSGP
jgi:hypothetical protein